MKVYRVKCVQKLPITLEKAWDFFSRPENLGRITPPHMNFNIVHASGPDEVFTGKLIEYRVSPFPLMRVTWVTEISMVQPGKYFIDEQRFGPFALWHHTHFFRQTESGVEMTDEVNYAIPLGWLGRLANALLVARQVNGIFEFRKKALEEIFRTS